MKVHFRLRLYSIAKEKHNAFFGTARGKTLIRNLTFDIMLDGFEKLLAMVPKV